MPFENRLCKQCGVQFRFMAAPSTIKRGGRGGFCSMSCSTTFNRTGKRSNNWNGGRVLVDSGHVWVYAPEDPHARPTGYALEHRVVMAAHLGRPLKRQEVVHHINGDPADNRIENLQLLASQSAHMTLHNSQRAENNNG